MTTYEIGQRVKYTCPRTMNTVQGTVTGLFRTSCGDPALVVQRDDGTIQRVCADRMRAGRIAPKGTNREMNLKAGE